MPLICFPFSPSQGKSSSDIYQNQNVISKLACSIKQKIKMHTKWDSTALDASLTGHLFDLSTSISKADGGGAFWRRSPELEPGVMAPPNVSLDPEGFMVLKGDELELMYPRRIFKGAIHKWRHISLTRFWTPSYQKTFILFTPFVQVLIPPPLEISLSWPDSRFWDR